MFGEKEIQGNAIVKSSKGKLKIPNFTGIEKDEEVVVFQVEANEEYWILSLSRFVEIMNSLEEKSKSVPSKEEAFKYRNYMKILCYHALRVVKCGKGNIISLPSLSTDKSLIESDSFELTGEGKKLILKPIKRSK